VCGVLEEWSERFLLLGLWAVALSGYYFRPPATTVCLKYERMRSGEVGRRDWRREVESAELGLVTGKVTWDGVKNDHG
jgi:hypothetical protein